MRRGHYPVGWGRLDVEVFRPWLERHGKTVPAIRPRVRVGLALLDPVSAPLVDQADFDAWPLTSERRRRCDEALARQAGSGTGLSWRAGVWHHSVMETHWSMIRRAAEGRPPDRDEFARHYGPVIRAYLQSRWRHSPLEGEVDDASQDVFVDCFRPGGALSRADPDRGSGFRGFLYGVVRNVARRREQDRARRRERGGPAAEDLDRLPADDESLTRVFDRAWAKALLKRAAALMAERAEQKGEVARRRVELLRLRFGEGRPIRDIAREWDVDAELLHTDSTRAREEFKTALRALVRDLEPEDGVDAECARLLDYLR